jgi:hypothetical protein
MAATDSIGGTLLSTYGMRLARLDGHLDLPKYKNILEINNLHSDLRKTEERKVKVKLYGFYSSKDAMATAVENLKTKIRGAVKQTWVFTDHGFSETCFVGEAVRVEVYNRKNVEINLTLNVTS